ncbi:MAG TPA: DUF1223 domain-containing protein [Polyangia bacterium]|nr:DUF1223 domain-containing protein [Polyangia bacterium]
MATRFTTAALIFLLVAGGDLRPARGASVGWNRVVLVELFTSQGCSSCPPADEFVRDFPRLGLGPEKVLPLTFHVNYWDDLGWRDPFASPAFTERQRWYADSGRLRSPGGAGGLSGLYTPQMIVDGTVHFPGGQRAVATVEIARAAARAAEVDLTGEAAVAGDDLTVTLRVAPRAGFDRAPDWRAVVALAAKSTQTRVLRGENRGETLVEAAVVRALSDRRPIGAAVGPLRITLRKPADLTWADVEVVAFVQSETTRQIAAARAIALPR